ncbi:MAG: signal peptidase II [Clostridia bacterium]|nr:signal peptidase II [Clostridia bacterium]
MIHIIYTVLFVLIDRLTKYLAVKYLMPIGSAVVLDGIFNLTYVENTGIAFGMLKGMNYIIVPLSIVIVAVCTYLLVKTVKSGKKIMPLALNFIISGAVGNIIDKLSYGFVVDFLEFAFIDFPVFNVADIFVCIGAVLLALIILFTKDGDVFGSDK